MKVARTFGPRGWKAPVAFLVALFVIARTLASFAGRIAPWLAVHYDVRLELGMVLGQIAFQWLLLWRLPFDQKLSYGWVLVAVSSLGAALLWPLLALGQTSMFFSVAWFFGVVGVMFVIHYRLVVQLALPAWLCATWVLYRLFLLVFLVRWR